MNIDCKIQILDFLIEQFSLEDENYEPSREGRQLNRITPEINSSNDYKSHYININLEMSVFKNGKMCTIKTISKFSLEFLMPYRIFNHFTTDFLINIFSQMILYSTGQAHGIFRQKTEGTVFEGFKLSTRFAESLALVTKDILAQLPVNTK